MSVATARSFPVCLDNMERPHKRRRLFASNNPDAELHERRARNDMKLKSIFESIFEKYGKDFSDVGDEVDLVTGKIIRDNGHLRTMNDEKDAGDEEDYSSAESEHLSLQDDIDEESSRSVIPDSQDCESSDDDPLGDLEHAICTTASRLKQSSVVPISQDRKGHSKVGRYSSTTSPHPTSSASRKPMGLLRIDHHPPVEEAWRVPALPQDTDPELALPSPEPSDLGDSDSTRSASPPGTSLWFVRQPAPWSKVRNQSKQITGQSVLRTPVATWTKEEDDLLQHLKTSITLSYSECLDRFPGRTISSLQSRWRVLSRGVQSVPAGTHTNAWTPEEDQLLRQLKSSTNKTALEIQQELPRRSINALHFRWHQLRHKIAQSPLRPRNPSSDSTDLPNPSRIIRDHASSQQAFSKQSVQPELSHALVESSHPGDNEAETSDTPASLVVIESDEAEPSSRSPEQRSFPAGTVIADSQPAIGTQGLADQTLDAQMHFADAVFRQKLDDIGHGIRHKWSPRSLGFEVNTDAVSGDLSKFDTSRRVSKTRSQTHAVDEDRSYHRSSPQSCSFQSTGAEPHALQHHDRGSPTLPESVLIPELQDLEHVHRAKADSNNRFSSDLIALPTGPASQSHCLSSMDHPADDLAPGSRKSQERLMAEVLDITALGSSSESHESPPLMEETSEGPASASQHNRTSTQHSNIAIDKAATTTRAEPPFVAEGNASPPRMYACFNEATANSITEPERPAATSQIFKHIEISNPPSATPSSPRVAPQILERSSRWIEPFTIVLPNINGVTDRVLAERQKYPMNKSYLAKEEASATRREEEPGHIERDISISPSTFMAQNPTVEHNVGIPQSATSPSIVRPADSVIANGSSPTRHSWERDTSSKTGLKRKQSSSSNTTAEDDEDDLQLSPKPAVATLLRKNRRSSDTASVRRLGSRPRIGADDISDDELSAPIKSIRNQAEMTPVRPVMAANRRLTSRF